MSLSRPLRIMRIIARLNIGGPAIHVVLLTDEFEKRGHQSQLVCGTVGEQEGDMSYLANEHHVQPIYIENLGREISLRHDLRTIYRLYKLMRQYRPDVVHTHTSKAGVVGRIAAFMARVPVRVHTLHGHVFYGYFGKLKTAFYLWIERLLALTTTRLITISPELKTELTQTYRIASEKRFAVVPLGLDLQKLTLARARNPEFLKTHRLPTDKKLVGIIGRLVPIKNHQLFLEAAKLVLQQRADVHFVIVGDGECRTDIEAMLDTLQLATQVTCVGWIEDVSTILAELDAVVLTSNNEGTPISLIEAMAFGVPVVSTAVGGVPDTLGHGTLGLLAERGNAIDVAEKLLAVLMGQHPELKAVQEITIARYDISRLTDDLETLYMDLLREKGSL